MALIVHDNREAMLEPNYSFIIKFIRFLSSQLCGQSSLDLDVGRLVGQIEIVVDGISNLIRDLNHRVHRVELNVKVILIEGLLLVRQLLDGVSFFVL